MPDNPAPSEKPFRRPGTLYRIAGCLFALAGLVSAITHHDGQTAVYLALCAVFLILGRNKARRSQ